MQPVPGWCSRRERRDRRDRGGPRTRHRGGLLAVEHARPLRGARQRRAQRAGAALGARGRRRTGARGGRGNLRGRGGGLLDGAAEGAQ